MWLTTCNEHRGQPLPCAECAADRRNAIQLLLLLIFAVALAVIGAVILARIEPVRDGHGEHGTLDRRGTHSGGPDAGYDSGW